MALLDREVEVSLNSFNVKYYEELGYEIPRNTKKDSRGKYTIIMGSKIKVKIEHLSKGSDVLVNVKCDCVDCKNPYLKPMSYEVYNRGKREGKKYYCNKCVNILFGSKTRMNNLLKEKGSFKDWCIENDRQDILDRWDYELNKLNPSDINYGTHEKYWFKCPKGIHNSELKNIRVFTRGDSEMNCNQCNSFAQRCIDNLGNDFLEKYWSNKNTLNPWEIGKNSTKKIWIKCQEKDYHKDYETTCSGFDMGNRCPYCSNHKVHPKDSFGQYIIDNFEKDFLDKIWSDKNKKYPFEYAPNSNKKVWWKCLDGKHEDYKRTVGASMSYNFRCSQCVREMDESILQNKVRLYLEKTNYTILHEYDCTILPINPKTKHILPFDNEIKDLKLVIEVMGSQHYNSSKWSTLTSKLKNTTPEYELHYIQLKDRYKKIKAIQQGYYYLEIPYWTDNKKEDWKQLIDNKLKEIIAIMKGNNTSLIN